MIHRYLYYIQAGKVGTFRYKEGNFHLLKYKGEDFCPVQEATYWNWWKKSISFIDSEDYIDFCFVGDNIEHFYTEHFQSTESTEWTLEKVGAFLQRYNKNHKIKLTYMNKESSISAYVINALQSYKYEETLGLNYYTIPSTSIEETNLSDTNDEVTSGLLREYYLKQL